MNLHKAILELRFESPSPAFNWRGVLFKAITGNKPEKEISLNESMEIRVKDQSAHILIQASSWAISVENIKSQENLIKFLYDFYVKINSVMVWGKGTRIGIRTIWNEPKEIPFSEAKQDLKKRVYNSNVLIDDSDDVALVLSFKDQEYNINYNFGLMEKDQLSETYCEFTNKENLSELNYIIDLDFSLMKDQMFTTKYFKNFLADSFINSEKLISKTKELYINVQQ